MDALSSLHAAFAAAFTQQHRLFELHFSDAALAGELLPHTLAGEEALSAPYRFRVECLGMDVALPLKQLIGQGADIRLLGGNEGSRQLAGIVTAAEQLGADGGFARFAVTVEPAFAALKLRRNSRVFQDKRVDQIVTALLDELIAANPVFARCFRHRSELSATLPLRSYCQQYRESDFDFIERLLREEGVSYRFDFAHGEEAVGVHTLVLFDAGSPLPVAAQPRVRFHRAAVTESDDTLTEWHGARHLQRGATALSSFDYKSVHVQQGADRSAIDQGEAGSGVMASLESYDPQALYYAADNDQLARYAQLRQQSCDLLAKSFSGGGVVRGLAAGHWFTLAQHPIHDVGDEADRQFVVLRQQLFARNNLPGELSGEFVGMQPSTDIAWPHEASSDSGFWNRIDAVRRHLPIVPVYSERVHARPTARGLQSATVVGAAGEEVFTDELGRIKIQFHWMRAVDHALDTQGATAQRDDHASCWVRVAYPSAGAEWGHQFIPRVGQEVLVDFIEGDIDRPLVIGALYNGHHQTPHFSGVGSLPANRALSGLQSREHRGNRYNELVLDDSTGQLRTRFASEHGSSQLNLGYLIHPRAEGGGEPGGEGFELRTDNAGSLRAAQGLLLTTEPQPQAGGGQLDRSALQAQLDAATALASQLGDSAKVAGANQPETGAGDRAVEADSRRGAAKSSGHLNHLLQSVRNLMRGSNTDPKAHSGAGEQPGQQPLLMLSGQDGVAITTPRCAVVASGSNLDLISSRDLHQSTGKRWIHTVGESISLFVAGNADKLKQTFKLLAASGNVQLQAQSGAIEVTANDALRLHALKEKQQWHAGKSILLECGGARVRIEGGDIDLHCPGTLTFRAGQHSVTG